MNLIKTKLEGVYIIENFLSIDDRGVFCKTFNQNLFKTKNMCTIFKESFYTISKKNVIRGMHFQLPPYSHEKLVYVVSGKIMDVVLDLRKRSKTYLEYISVNISEENRKSVYIPKGLAHGYKALEDGTTTVYNVSTVYNQKSDTGIRWDSFGMDWKTENPIISDKDKGVAKLDDFKSPF